MTQSQANLYSWEIPNKVTDGRFRRLQLFCQKMKDENISVQRYEDLKVCAFSQLRVTRLRNCVNWLHNTHNITYTLLHNTHNNTYKRYTQEVMMDDNTSNEVLLNSRLSRNSTVPPTPPPPDTRPVDARRR